MKITKEENYYIIDEDQNDVSTFSEALTHAYDQVKGQNIIVDLLSYESLGPQDLLSFVTLSNRHRQQKSFILVNDTLSIDDVPEELVIVPSIREAIDFIAMEDLERDFGLFE